MAVILDRPAGTYPLSTYRNHEMGISEPSGDQLRRLAQAGCDIAWLITGEGEPRPGRFSSRATESDDAEIVSIPHYAVQLSAGNGRSTADFDELERLVLPADWVRRVFGRPAAHLVLAGAAGTSMEPTIRDRDLLVVDTADQRLTSGRVYALVVGDTLLVKRIERTLRGQIFLRSDNSAYQSEELTEDLADTVRILGQVIWHGGSLE
jgi:phage repressor protein C with HTH and peptisase S24 domain